MSDATERAVGIKAATVVAPRPSIYTVQLDSESVLLDEANDRLHHLNPSATLVWQCFDGVATVGEIAHDMSDVLGEDARAVLDQTISVTTQLADEGLLELRNP
jgi:hypothetical protein